ASSMCGVLRRTGWKCLTPASCTFVSRLSTRPSTSPSVRTRRNEPSLLRSRSIECIRRREATDLALSHRKIAKPCRPIPRQRAADADGMRLSRHVDLDLIGFPLQRPHGASNHRKVARGWDPNRARRRFRPHLDIELCPPARLVDSGWHRAPPAQAFAAPGLSSERLRKPTLAPPPGGGAARNAQRAAAAGRARVRKRHLVPVHPPVARGRPEIWHFTIAGQRQIAGRSGKLGSRPDWSASGTIGAGRGRALQERKDVGFPARVRSMQVLLCPGLGIDRADPPPPPLR